MGTTTPRQRKYAVLQAVAIATAASAVLLIVWRIIAIFTMFSVLVWLGLLPRHSPARYLAVSSMLALGLDSAPTATPPPATATPAPPVAGGPVQVLADGSEMPVAVMTGSAEVAYRAWMIALVTQDAPAALALYRPAAAGDPAAAVERNIADLRSLFPGRGDREGPLGALVDMRDAGEYADPAEPGVRYTVTRITFERGEACFQGALVEHSDGWYVRGWGRLSEAECAEALARIAEG